MGTKKLNRETFTTSRLLDFCSRTELVAQVGHAEADWPLVVLKELLDNAVDACEDAGTPPAVRVTVDAQGITVADNGPGIPPDTVAGVLDFAVRVSSREAYVSPTRGAQGNALKTVVAMPFVLDGRQGRVTIAARGVRHEITLRVDRIRQQPIIDHRPEPDRLVKAGTAVQVRWPESASAILRNARLRFLDIAADYTFLNPHLTLAVGCFAEEPTHIRATDPGWRKWLPSDPTCPHWYTPERFGRLVAAYLAHDADNGRKRTVREFVAEFRGLTGTAKQKRVLDETGLARLGLSALRNGDGLDEARTGQLLEAMRQHSRAVKPAALGVIGKDHLAKRFEGLGCDMRTFEYRKVADVSEGLPWVAETAFAWCPDAESRRLVTGVNWSPGIVNPFRQLGRWGQSLDAVLEQQRAGRDEPVVLALHLACPRVEYTDRGKSAVVIGGAAEEEE
jgi:DNA topoisomerase VI subunit B